MSQERSLGQRHLALAGWPVLVCVLAVCAVILLSACGGGSDDPPAAQPSGPFVTTLAQGTMRDSHVTVGPSVSEYSAAYGAPQYTAPAGATVEACADVTLVVHTVGGATIAYESSMFGVAGGAPELSPNVIILAGPGAAGPRAERCATVLDQNALAVQMRVIASNAVMSRYEATVRWTVKATVP